MQKESKEWKKCIPWLVLVIIAICLYKLLDNFGDITAWLSGLISILMPFIMALIVAYLFYLPCKKLEGLFKKTKVKFISNRARKLSIFIVYFVVLLVLVGIIKFVVPSVYESVTELANALPGYYNKAMETINSLPEDFVINKENLGSIIEGLNTIKIEDFLNLERITEISKGIIGFATTIFDIFVTVVVSVYLLAERTEIVKFAKRLCRSYI